MCKVQIRTILGLSCTNLRSKLCVTILRLAAQSTGCILRRAQNVDEWPIFGLPMLLDEAWITSRAEFTRLKITLHVHSQLHRIIDNIAFLCMA